MGAEECAPPSMGRPEPTANRPLLAWGKGEEGRIGRSVERMDRER